MPRGAKVKIEKDVLAWAREAIGFSLADVSKITSIPVEDIQKWEVESSDIYLSDIKKIAKAYKRQLAFFFLPSAPKEKPIPGDFRTLDSVKQDEIPGKVRLAIRRAQANRKIISEFFADDYSSKIDLTITLNDDPTKVAQKIRETFAVKIEDQFALKDEKNALAFWIGEIEKKGVPIFQMDLDTNFRGFCLRENNLPPVIVINAKDARAGKIFTAIHEFCHLFIKQDEIDQLVYQRGEVKTHVAIEAFANEFAGSFLVPNAILQNEPLYAQYKETKSDELISKLARRFGVSGIVILRRMHVLGVITKDYYEKKVEELKIKYEQQKLIERAKMKADPNSFPVRNVPRETLQKVGLSLSSKAFKAVSDGRMTTFELVRFLDIKTKHVSGVQDLLAKKYLSLS